MTWDGARHSNTKKTLAETKTDIQTARQTDRQTGRSEYFPDAIKINGNACYVRLCKY